MVIVKIQLDSDSYLNQRGLHFGLMAPRYLAWGRGSFGSKSALDIFYEVTHNTT